MKHEIQIKNVPELKVVHNDRLLTETGLSYILSKHPGSKYVGEFCPVNVNGQYVNQPMAVFWTPIAHPEGSNFFGIYYDFVGGHSMITNGLSAVSGEIIGLRLNDTVIYSAFRHDCQDHGVAFIDGGRDYTRHGGGSELVKLTVDSEGNWIIS